MVKSLVPALLFGALFGGCVASGSGRYSSSASAEVSAPDLVFVSPGVQVIADYDEPVFYSDNYYWRNDGGVWYRSTSHTRGWVRYEAPPAIRQIDRPSAYVHFHGNVDASGGTEVRDHREYRPAPQEVEVRDHRDRDVRPMPPQPQPVEVRDHRDHEMRPEPAQQPQQVEVRDHREHREERKEDKHEHRDEVRDHRH